MWVFKEQISPEVKDLYREYNWIKGGFLTLTYEEYQNMDWSRAMGFSLIMAEENKLRQKEKDSESDTSRWRH